MNNPDIRWHQRLSNFNLALQQLAQAISLSSKRELSQLEQQGMNQAFEYNFELAWNVIKDFYQAQGETDIQGSRDAFRLAFTLGLVINGDVWVNMIKSRSLTSYTYNQATANAILKLVKSDYFPEFNTLFETLYNIKNKEQ